MPAHRVYWWLAWLWLGAATAAYAADPAGKVLFATGEARATDAAGVLRVLERGEPVFSGDLLATGDGQLQVRFSDGAMVALRPFSHFRVDEYRYAGAEDGNERAFFSLLKGGLRTLTGAIGRTNRDTYGVSTFAVDIGIRGTGYNARVCQGDCAADDLADGVHVNVSQGALLLKNDAGVLELAVGQTAFVADFNTLPNLVVPPDLTVDPDASDILPEIGADEQLTPDAHDTGQHPVP